MRPCTACRLSRQSEDTASQFLELKIPPLAQFALFGLAMWGVAQAVPSAHLDGSWATWIAAALAAAGATVGILAVREFRKARTTVDPMTPAKAESLVATGIFSLTRNPMYLGLLLLLAAWALYLSNWASGLLLPGFVVCIQRLQIRPEERILARKFGSDFEAYAARVRRWL